MKSTEVFKSAGNQNQEEHFSNFEEETFDSFVDLLDKEPGATDIVHELKMRFNELESVTKRSYEEALESVRPKERVRVVDMYAQRSALDYLSLHKHIDEVLDLAEHLSDEEKKEIRMESRNTAAFFEGHTLLAFYANRNGVEKKMNPVDRNTESAALQQYMAQFYLRHQDKIGDIDSRLDKYGKKAFGSQGEYVRFKKGVISLADAYQHLDSMGHQVFSHQHDSMLSTL